MLSTTKHICIEVSAAERIVLVIAGLRVRCSLAAAHLPVICQTCVIFQQFFGETK